MNLNKTRHLLFYAANTVSNKEAVAISLSHVSSTLRRSVVDMFHQKAVFDYLALFLTRTGTLFYAVSEKTHVFNIDEKRTLNCFLISFSFYFIYSVPAAPFGIIVGEICRTKKKTN